jgi:hypothetical protein
MMMMMTTDDDDDDDDDDDNNDDDDDDDNDVCFVLHQHLCWIFIVLPHGNNSLSVDM